MIHDNNKGIQNNKFNFGCFNHFSKGRIGKKTLLQGCEPD